MLAILALSRQPARAHIFFVCRNPNLEIAGVLVVLFAVKPHVFPGGFVSFGGVGIAVLDEPVVGLDLHLVIGDRRILRPQHVG